MVATALREALFLNSRASFRLKFIAKYAFARKAVNRLNTTVDLDIEAGYREEDHFEDFDGEVSGAAFYGVRCLYRMNKLGLS